LIVEVALTFTVDRSYLRMLYGDIHTRQLLLYILEDSGIKSPSLRCYVLSQNNTIQSDISGIVLLQAAKTTSACARMLASTSPPSLSSLQVHPIRSPLSLCSSAARDHHLSSCWSTLKPFKEHDIFPAGFLFTVDQLCTSLFRSASSLCRAASVVGTFDPGRAGG